MRRGLVAAVLVACTSPDPGERVLDPRGPEVAAGSDEQDPGRRPAVVDAVALHAVPFPNDALGRSLAVQLTASARAVVTYTLADAPPRWRQLVPLGATWSWSESDPGAGFAEPSFDDGGWASGPAPFGREDAAETLIAPQASEPPATVWFRTTFDVADPAAIRALDAVVRRDDGVVVWLNGVEVFRDNVPALVKQTGDDERTL